jgi:ferredoxin
MVRGAYARQAGRMDRSTRIHRPAAMRIDPRRCRRSGLCRLIAPGLAEGTSVPMGPDTLEAMAACPSGALAWVEPPAGEERRDP